MRLLRLQRYPVVRIRLRRSTLQASQLSDLLNRVTRAAAHIVATEPQYQQLAAFDQDFRLLRVRSGSELDIFGVFVFLAPVLNKVAYDLSVNVVASYVRSFLDSISRTTGTEANINTPVAELVHAITSDSTVYGAEFSHLQFDPHTGRLTSMTSAVIRPFRPTTELVGNLRTRVAHAEDCAQALAVEVENKVPLPSRKVARALGFRLHRVCL